MSRMNGKKTHTQYAFINFNVNHQPSQIAVLLNKKHLFTGRKLNAFKSKEERIDHMYRNSDSSGINGTYSRY